jgi:hypothetical protein
MDEEIKFYSSSAHINSQKRSLFASYKSYYEKTMPTYPTKLLSGLMS